MLPAFAVSSYPKPRAGGAHAQGERRTDSGWGLRIFGGPGAPKDKIRSLTLAIFSMQGKQDTASYQQCCDYAYCKCCGARVGQCRCRLSLSCGIGKCLFIGMVLLDLASAWARGRLELLLAGSRLASFRLFRRFGLFLGNRSPFFRLRGGGFSFFLRTPTIRRTLTIRGVLTLGRPVLFRILWGSSVS